jgi:hypothetical protein
VNDSGHNHLSWRRSGRFPLRTRKWRESYNSANTRLLNAGVVKRFLQQNISREGALLGQDAIRCRPAHYERQDFHHPSCAMGVVTHIVKMAGILSPLLILELVKEPAKASRWIRIASVATVGVTETF